MQSTTTTTTITKTSQILTQQNNPTIQNIKNKIEQKITLRGFKSLSRKTMFSPTCNTANTNNISNTNANTNANINMNNISNTNSNSNLNDHQNMSTKYNKDQSYSQLQNKQNIKDTLNTNTNTNTNQNTKNVIRYTQNHDKIKNNQPQQKNTIKTNQNQQNNINSSNTQLTKCQNKQRNNSNGFRYLHGRTLSNRSSSKNKQNQQLKQKQKQKQNVTELNTQYYQQKIKQNQKRKSRDKKLSLYENSPISNSNISYHIKSNQIKQFGFSKNNGNGNKLTLNSGNKKFNQQNISNNTNTTNNNTGMYRSPSKNPLYVTVNNNYGNIICESVSKDGQYKVISRALNAEQLKQASQLQHHINLKSKKQAMKQLQIQSMNSQLNFNLNLNLNVNTHYRTNSSNSPRLTQKQKQKYVLDPSKISNKQNGNVKAYAVNSNQGISRKYNEDRVSIILNIVKNGVRASFFAIYDGHGGSNCCDFLTQNLHQYIFNSKYFPTQPRQALIEGMKLAQTKFIENVKNTYQQKKQLDKSGSCAIILLIVGDDCYIANLGDSRAVLSTCNGKPMYSLSRDHKPTDSGQQARILKQGGKIYRTQMMKIKKQTHSFENKRQDDSRSYGNIQQQQTATQNQIILGPLRVYPGKLSVTRTFGDIEAKQPQLGGIRNCIGTDPQICKYTLSGKQDFILLGCDGLFQKLDSEQVIQQAWKTIKKNKGTIHQAVGSAAQSVVKLCMDRKSTDNITAIVVALGSLGLENNLSDYASV